MEQIELTPVQELENEIAEMEKGLALSAAMVELSEMPQFDLVFNQQFVKSYRDTAVVNVGMVKQEAKQGIMQGLISRALFEQFVDSLIGAKPELEETIKVMKEELAIEKKAEVEEALAKEDED